VSRKIRLTYAEFVRLQTAKKTPGTVAGIIERFIAEMSLPHMKPLGASHWYTLRRIQRMPIGALIASDLKKTHIVDMVKDLRTKVCAATAQQYVCFLTGVLKYAPSAWEDCEDISDAAIAAAKPTLVKYQLIGKSTPRKRVPTEAELDALLAYYATPPRRGKKRIIRMPDIIAFALGSTRRIGEICRIRRPDIDWDRKDEQGNPTPMYLVRDMKHPTKKLGNHKWFALFSELAEIIRIQPVHLTDDRVFPFNAKSCSASYTIAKRAIGIQGLRFHDNRRAAITRWLARLKDPHKVRFISGHENTLILERVYDATDPVVLHAELAKADAAASRRRAGVGE
jgi:integrase